MDTIALLRSGFQGAHGILEATMNDVTPDQAHWTPPGIANPLGATYAHVVLGEDALLHGMVMGSPPLSATTWAGKTGLSEMPPARGTGDYGKWTRSVQVDLPALRELAKAVYAETDGWLGSLGEEGLEKPLDLSRFGMGEQTVGYFVGGIVLQHVNNHCGEISCLKGIQGAKGYPF
ncbi:MAG: DinB family protein [Dehalococcoidia bacterium]